MTTNGAIDISQENFVKVLGHNAGDILVANWNPWFDILATGSSTHEAKLWLFDPILSYIDLKEQDNSDTESDDDDDDDNNRIVDRGVRITAFDWKPDGLFLLIANSHNRINIYNLKGELLLRLKIHDAKVLDAKWNKNGKLIASAALNGSVIVWDGDTLLVNRTFKVHSGRPISEIAWNSNKTFATCGFDYKITYFNLENAPGNEIKTFSGHVNKIHNIVWNSQGKLLASCSDDKTIKIWSMDQDTFIHNLRAHSTNFYKIGWLPQPFVRNNYVDNNTQNVNNCSILITSSCDNEIRFWDSERGIIIRTLDKTALCSFSCSPDGKYIATADINYKISIWCTESGQLLHHLYCGEHISEISFNYNGERLAFTTEPGYVYIVDLRVILHNP